MLRPHGAPGEHSPAPRLLHTPQRYLLLAFQPHHVATACRTSSMFRSDTVSAFGLRGERVPLRGDHAVRSQSISNDVHAAATTPQPHIVPQVFPTVSPHAVMHHR